MHKPSAHQGQKTGNIGLMHQDQFAEVVRYMLWLLTNDSSLLQVFFKEDTFPHTKVKISD
jgi:hypothetical protein